MPVSFNALAMGDPLQYDDEPYIGRNYNVSHKKFPPLNSV